uniref:Predicted protein n=1 Tax=Hordeum vulgare subsp. vulgare TaxID=112509 RepID=F2DBA6_HORVV|nr:predicted protein [Hordeum vulgare subsp. vulgare]
MAAHKRLHDGFEQDADQPEKKRMERSVSFSTVIREAMVMKQVQSVFLVLEPLLRRVVQEEIQAGLVRSPRYIERSSSETPSPSAQPPAWRLEFLRPPMLPIFTGSTIVDVKGEPLQVILVDADTGSPCGALPQFMRVELVPLFGDFAADGRDEWTAGEFARNIVKERDGKRPLLTGDVGLGMRDGRAVANDLQFTDNSSWVRCRKFRIGARVAPGGYDGGRVAEAMTDAFNVRDHRGELYRKHYPPALGDEVWRLEKIGKVGAFHRKLREHGVETVQEFLRMLTVKPDVLRAIMGDGMTDRMWEATTSHAKTCHAGDKVYAYAGQHGAVVYVNSIHQLVRLEFAGVECAAQQLSRDQKAYVQQLYVEAFEQRANLLEADPPAAAMPIHASTSTNSLPMLQNASPVAPLSANPIWYQGTPGMDFQIVDQNDSFNFQMDFQNNFG